MGKAADIVRDALDQVDESFIVIHHSSVVVVVERDGRNIATVRSFYDAYSIELQSAKYTLNSEDDEFGRDHPDEWLRGTIRRLWIFGLWGSRWGQRLYVPCNSNDDEHPRFRSARRIWTAFR
jgi:hypothetical protein